ncbi:hypothetical protein BDY21DRAFT_356953 [Lineolata rhizophorae]|uniref:Secreted protein n=1 Tax=Lineolata rhizophorae TaxID=578093 RepID=A0A6A6NPM9_9PEZI|nr:hypothetical protein BDY21DRAFT_356953 [Lineolata rhizophorae]
MLVQGQIYIAFLCFATLFSNTSHYNSTAEQGSTGITVQAMRSRGCKGGLARASKLNLLHPPSSAPNFFQVHFSPSALQKFAIKLLLLALDVATLPIQHP